MIRKSFLKIEFGDSKKKKKKKIMFLIVATNGQTFPSDVAAD